jgi:hypothetical protein
VGVGSLESGYMLDVSVSLMLTWHGMDYRSDRLPEKPRLVENTAACEELSSSDVRTKHEMAGQKTMHETCLWLAQDARKSRP